MGQPYNTIIGQEITRLSLALMHLMIKPLDTANVAHTNLSKVILFFRHILSKILIKSTCQTRKLTKYKYLFTLTSHTA